MSKLKIKSLRTRLTVLRDEMLSCWTDAQRASVQAVISLTEAQLRAAGVTRV